MPVYPLGPVNMVGQSMSLPAKAQGLYEAGMKMQAQGMDGRKNPATTVRLFQVSPAVSGKTFWNLDTDGPLSVLVTAANTTNTVTITPLTSGSVNISAWGQGTTASKGGYVKAVLYVVSGTPYVLTCGRGPGQGGLGDSGAAYWGGGYTGVFQNTVSQTNAMLIAAGGGGSQTGAPSNPGGDGNYPSGGSGTGLNAPDGGTQTAGGAYNGGPESANGTSGSALQGGRGADMSVAGNGWSGGGGGGGGYFGGGGGPGGGSYSGSGAGGSSFLKPGNTLISYSFSDGLTDPKRTNSAGTNYAGLLSLY